MIITRKIIVGVCIVCAVGTSYSSMAQNRVVTQHTAGTVVEGEVTMLVTQGIVRFERKGKDKKQCSVHPVA